MRNARDLLVTSELAVASIAEKVGYQSDLSFVKVFKKMHGVTPRAFRLDTDRK
jgi:two-component system response regulator YesN